MILDDATRNHVLEVIKKALEEDDLVSRALVAHISPRHLTSPKASTGDGLSTLSRLFILLHMIAALAFTFLVLASLFLCYVKFLIRKRSFREHYAAWQTTLLNAKPQRYQMFAEAVGQQHRITQSEQRKQMDGQSEEAVGQDDRGEK
jgi:hypothetical protein